MAAMREALEYASRVLAKWRLDAPLRAWAEYDEAISRARDALAEPLRNCDRFANEAEASKAFIVWYNTVYELNGDKWNEVSSCDLKHNIDDILHDYIKWLFTPATEKKGENDESK